MATNKIKEIVFSFFDMMGIKIIEIESGIWSAAIPESEHHFFNGCEEVKFTFERENAEKHRDLELICEGSFLLRKIIERLARVPKVSRLFATAEPEMAPSTNSTELRVVDSERVYYRQKVIFNFKVQFECDQRQEKLYSIEADPADSGLNLSQGLINIDMDKFSETPQSGIKIEESGTDVLRLYLQSCQKLEQELVDEIKELKSWGEDQCKVELKKFEAYLDEQKQELLKKKDNVCFHLYFFQKEEEIDTLINNLESERQRKISELQDKFALKVNINLINAVVLCVPTIGTISKKGKKVAGAKVEATQVKITLKTES